MQAAKLLAVMVDGVFGRRCVFCGLADVHDTAICAACYADLPWRANMIDPSPGQFEHVIVPLRYAFPIDAAIKAFKFQRKLFYAPAFEELLLAAALPLLADVDAVLSVPLHWRRKALRGFNQADELAYALAESIGCPVIRNITRRKATRYQSGLSRRQRRRNLRKVFAVRGRVAHEHVLIVDDIVTTGATMAALRKLLHKNGVQRVSVAALARTD